MKITNFFVLASLITTWGFSTAANALPGDDCGSQPEGPEYVLRGQLATFKSKGPINYVGQEVDFWNSDGDSGSSSLKISGTESKATQKLTFSSRGMAYAYALPPWTSGQFDCNQIWSHNAPTISKVSFTKSTRTIVVNYSVDNLYSMAARTSTPVTITYTWRSDFYGTTGTIGTQTTNALSGQMSYNFYVPATKDLYFIYASVSDGKYSKSIQVGSFLQSTGPGGGIPL